MLSTVILKNDRAMGELMGGIGVISVLISVILEVSRWTLSTVIPKNDRAMGELMGGNGVISVFELANCNHVERREPFRNSLDMMYTVGYGKRELYCSIDYSSYLVRAVEVGCEHSARLIAALYGCFV